MKNLVYICIAIFMFSCNSAKNTQLMVPKVISEGDLYGSGSEVLMSQNTVIATKTEWKELVAKINATNQTLTKDQIDAIDFDEESVIVLIDQQRNTGGHKIEIGETYSQNGIVYFTIKKTHPEGMATSVMTQPYYLATIPKTKQEIEFKEAE
ncbi:protease complex subunit PrcB family protein [Mesonia sp.]|uniref:protease complex subunit PrcB family protein n=1 Tax=Mesonia sp. TaxID=1960830 RepID=UPI001762B085|nr:protease complex subunit PrcB family protein [Mesonia sp.]HIB37925.1 protease complex subunit PrcB family protein [Mesonia sp.]HIO26154.1 protease complex subunit PrcB family protein [Flavobacteriaceae bacterium]